MTIKKTICLIILSLMFTGIAAAYYYPAISIGKGDGLSREEVIRFHVLAHSDNIRDQQVKTVVTEEVLGHVEEILVESESPEQARKKLEGKTSNIKHYVKDILEREGTPHPVEVKLENHAFPDREYHYGDFPAGDYEALRIIIGDGAGENWWCVLFPPLCFTHRPDSQEPDTRRDKTEVEVKKVNAEDAEDAEKDNKKVANLDQDKVEVRFRIVEWTKEFFPAHYRADKKDN